MSDASAITGLVLAGGQSRRMGRDKTQVSVGGQTLLQRAHDLLRDAGCDTVLVAGSDDLPDRFPSKGPLAGIDAALQKVTSGRLLVVPVDMPKLQPETIKTLMEQQVATYFESESLPCVLPVSIPLQEYLSAVLMADDADRSLMALYRHLGAQTLPIADKAEFHNCNRPEDLENLA